MTACTDRHSDTKNSIPKELVSCFCTWVTIPRPVEDNTRGTVEFVDDIGTIRCSFDNGRQLGIIPGEDSFRKLTDEELAEEQDDSEDMDEDNGPVMGM